MAARLWHMNVDFEMELAVAVGSFRRQQSYEAANHRLAGHLLWLAAPGDGLLLAEPWSPELRRAAAARGVELVAPDRAPAQHARIFTPWGWTASAIEAGNRVNAIVTPISLEIV